LGDVAMTVPVVTAFLRTHPGYKVSILTKEKFIPLFHHLSEISVIGVDFKTDYKGFYGLFRLAKKIKELRVDVVADMHNVLRTKILRFLLPNVSFSRLDKGRAEKQQLIKGAVFKPLKTTIERYADVFRALGLELSLSAPHFPRPLPLSQSLKTHLGSASRPFIGIAPFAAYTSKMYPIQQMKEVISKLSNTYTVLLFGSGAYEIKIIEAIVRQFPNVKSVAGVYSMQEELTLMSHLKVMLAMDSGNAHMAAMMGVNVITLWGVTHPYAGFAPFNQPSENCLLADRKKYPKIPTSIYGNKHSKSYSNAMASIAVEEVLSAVKKAL
jgi:ADP-heptose:LPS heptosyltransferase